MIRHLIKLFWARKAKNVLLLFEIVISFLVLYVVVFMGMSYAQGWSDPIGFDYEDRYVLNFDWMAMEDADPEDHPQLFQQSVQIKEQIETLPEVKGVAAAFPNVYGMAMSRTEIEYGGQDMSPHYIDISDEGMDVFNFEIVEGRWFGPEDDGMDYSPVVLEKKTADLLGQGDNLIGQFIDEDQEYRVVGLVKRFRYGGELSLPKEFMFVRQDMRIDQEDPDLLFSLTIQVQPGSSADIEEKILDVARSVAPDWTMTIKSIAKSREGMLKLKMVPLIIVLLICGFLLAMVVLGLLGVFWQAVVSRVEEIGLRRAMGGSTSSIYRQILGEVLVLTLMGSIIASALILQLPLLGILSSYGWPLILSALFASLVIIFGLTVLSGLYPAYVASRIQPAQALHHV
jgi:putative ABC transport system permease protein